MESELSDLSREKKALDLAMMETKHRLSATTKEMMKEREQSHNLKVELRNVKAGLHNTSRFIQEPKELKEAVKSLYKKHLHDFDQVFMYYSTNKCMWLYNLSVRLADIIILDPDVHKRMTFGGLLYKPLTSPLPPDSQFQYCI